VKKFMRNVYGGIRPSYTQGSKLAKMKGILKHKSLSNTTELYSHTQPSPGWPRLCQGHRLLVWLATVLEKKQLEKADPFSLVVCGSDI